MFKSKQEVRDYMNSFDTVLSHRYMKALEFFNKHKSIKFVNNDNGVDFFYEIRVVAPWSNELNWSLSCTCYFPHAGGTYRISELPRLLAIYLSMDYVEGSGVDYSYADDFLDEFKHILESEEPTKENNESGN